MFIGFAGFWAPTGISVDVDANHFVGSEKTILDALL